LSHVSRWRSIAGARLLSGMSSSGAQLAKGDKARQVEDATIPEEGTYDRLQEANVLDPQRNAGCHRPVPAAAERHSRASRILQGNAFFPWRNRTRSPRWRLIIN